MDEFTPQRDGSWDQPLSSPDAAAPGVGSEERELRRALQRDPSGPMSASEAQPSQQAHSSREAQPIQQAQLSPAPVPPTVRPLVSVHPLDRPDDAPPASVDEAARIKLAWAKLVWLLSFLAVLLAISYLVPYIAENTQYAITRGRQRAEHDFAREHLGGSSLQELSRAYQMVSQSVGPSVVHINTQAGPSDLFRLSTRGRSSMLAEGQGSGFVVDASGYIVTNNHVVSGAQNITVSLADGRRVPAELVGADRGTDLAVLKIKADKLTPVVWGDSDDTQVGALVWAVGSPFGLERSITSGIVSAKHRSGMASPGSAQYQDYLQSDAAVNPGNSGGPLVNSQGHVIGVNTAIVGDVYQGISFSIPSNTVRYVFERIKAEGSVRRGWLGVELQPLTDTQAAEIGLPDANGVYISGLYRQGDSPAEKAGILPGDVILRWNGTVVPRLDDLRRLVALTEIGSTASVVVYRDGQELLLEVIVGERPPLE
jgi:serine protease Do